jgi:hypothetical protein
MGAQLIELRGKMRNLGKLLRNLGPALITAELIEISRRKGKKK